MGTEEKMQTISPAKECSGICGWILNLRMHISNISLRNIHVYEHSNAVENNSEIYLISGMFRYYICLWKDTETERLEY